MDENIENCLVETWLDQSQNLMEVYREPVLEEDAVNFLKNACETLRQDLSVFIMSVDILERYIYLKEERRQKITDPVLVALVSLFIAGKYLGGGVELKISLLKQLLGKWTSQPRSRGLINSSEKEMLAVLHYQLPSTTLLDDFNIFFEYFLRKYRLQDVLRAICTDILVSLCCTKLQWFFELKEVYKEEVRTFQQLCCVRNYLPAGILISALRSTNYTFMDGVSDNGLLLDIKLLTAIHEDHINVLAATILARLNNSTCA